MYLFSDRSLVDMTTTNHRVRSIHIVVYIWLIQLKIALGIGNWVLGSYCLVVTQANHYIVSYDQMLNAPLPIPNAQGNLYWIKYMYFQYIRTQWPGCFKQSDWFAISDVIFTALQGGKLKQNNSADVKAVFCQSSRLGTYENKKKTLKRWSFWRKKTSVFKTAFSDLL